MERYLKVRVYSARDLYDRHTFGRQHPYCKLSLSGRKFKTSVYDEGGRSPVWDEVFVFPDVDPQEDQLVIKVKEKTFTSNKFVGECRLPLSLFVNGSVVDQWYTLNYDSEPVGEINLRVQLKEKIDLEPAVVVAPAVMMNPTPAYPPQQPCYQQPPYYEQPPQQPYYQQPPAYGYPPQQPAAVAYAAGPPVMVVEGRRHHGYDSPGCSPRRYDRSPRGYDRPPRGSYDCDYDRGYERRNEGREFSGAQVAMGVGAGVLGGLVLGEVVDDVFGDDD